MKKTPIVAFFFGTFIFFSYLCSNNREKGENGGLGVLKMAMASAENRVIDCLWTVPKYHPEIRIICFDLMPDYIHTIWHVTRPILSSPHGNTTRRRNKSLEMNVSP